MVMGNRVLKASEGLALIVLDDSRLSGKWVVMVASHRHFVENDETPTSK
jgi:hypothetical protein